MLKIINQHERVLLSRKEIEAEAMFDKKVTPSNEEVRKELAKQLGSDEKLIVVKEIIGGYSLNKAKVLAYQYISEEGMKDIEPKPKESKKKGAEKENAAPKKEAK